MERLTLILPMPKKKMLDMHQGIYDQLMKRDQILAVFRSDLIVDIDP